MKVIFTVVIWGFNGINWTHDLRDNGGGCSTNWAMKQSLEVGQDPSKFNLYPTLDLLPMRLHSSVARALHRYHGGQIPVKPQIFFWTFFAAILKLLHNCEDHFHFHSLSTVHIYVYMIYCISWYMHIISLNRELILMAQNRNEIFTPKFNYWNQSFDCCIKCLNYNSQILQS